MIVREVVHAHVPVLSEHSSVREAIDKMDIYQFPGLVILDDDQRPIGVVTEGDIARAVCLRGSLMTLAHEDAMVVGTRDPRTESADIEVSDALHTMLMSGLTVLPIVDEGVFVGMVLRVDLMHAMLLDTPGY